MLVGKAVSSFAEAVAAEQAGADYLVVKPVFFSHYWLERSPLTHWARRVLLQLRIFAVSVNLPGTPRPPLPPT
jgi:hypothetical protein